MKISLSARDFKKEVADLRISFLKQVERATALPPIRHKPVLVAAQWFDSNVPEQLNADTMRYLNKFITLSEFKADIASGWERTHYQSAA